ncbi:MAG TPA: hypothetical protein VGQ39_20455 [Pyrinomonadaceae bacterium]|nr:hypothetical protein [Pyrinomonadaceae bacterium]
MKRRLTMAVTFSLLLLATVIALPQSIEAQQENPPRPTSLRSGLIPLGPNQFVRLTLANAAVNPNANEKLTVRLNVRILQYAPTGQTGMVKEHAVVGQISSGPITIAPGGAASIDFDLTQATQPNVQGFFFIVETLPLAGASNDAKATANAVVYDASLNQPLSVWIWVEAEGGYVWM